MYFFWKSLKLSVLSSPKNSARCFSVASSSASSARNIHLYSVHLEGFIRFPALPIERPVQRPRLSVKACVPLLHNVRALGLCILSRMASICALSAF